MDTALSAGHRILFAAAQLAALSAVVYTGMVVGELPAEVPIHVSLTGETNAVGPRWLVWSVPIVMSVLVAALWLLARFHSTATAHGQELSAEGRSAVIGPMRTMLGVLALSVAALAWEAPLAQSERAAAPPGLSAAVALAPLVIGVLEMIRLRPEHRQTRMSTERHPGHVRRRLEGTSVVSPQ